MSLMSWLRNLFSRPARPQEMALGRNDLCWCGSGKKYKRCHLASDAAKQREAGYAAQFTARNRVGDGIVPGGSKKPQRPQENRPMGEKR